MNSFKEFSATPNNPNWEKLISRSATEELRGEDVRNDFAKDYTRILHSLAYRRLKHKTQVFYNIGNDHICTRMEHVSHVESVSSTIAGALDLNTDLTKAIATAHDLGHAPFGHKGENIIRELSRNYLNQNFWHEQNGLRFVDCLELLENRQMKYKNLNLTYAVRDGIISHCGEIDKNFLTPREELIDLRDFISPGQYESATWEGCVVKLSDKIAYVGRDIEDAKRLNFLEENDLKQLEKFARGFDADAVNTTVIINSLIMNVCKNSSPDKGICLSEDYAQRLKEIKQFNTERIYNNERLKHFESYAKLIINTLFNILLDAFDGQNTFKELKTREHLYPSIYSDYSNWLTKYVDKQLVEDVHDIDKYICDPIYGKLETKEQYIQSIIDFISGMTDSYAIKLYNEVITF